MKKCITLLFLIALAYVFNPQRTSAATFPNLSVAFEPVAQKVNVSGILTSGEGKTIGLSFWDPSGELIHMTEVSGQPDGSFIASYTLKTGSPEGVYLVKAGADDVSSLQTRTFVVGDLQYKIADLRSISLDDIALEGFDPDDAVYRMDAAAGVREVKVTAELEQNGATMKINGKNASNNRPFGPIKLANRDNVILIEVTSKDKSNTKIYRITVNAQVSASGGAPGAPVLSDDNGHDTGLLDGAYRIAMNMWWGNNGTQYKLYENDALIDTQTLADDGPNAQKAVTDIADRPNGTYTYYAELTNAYGTTRSAAHTVKVTQAAPSKPVLSHDNWDGDGDYTVNMNMWWGTNGTQYRLYENGELTDTKTLKASSPQAQHASTVIQGKPPGIYEYVAELANDAGKTVSQSIRIQVKRTK